MAQGTQGLLIGSRYRLERILGAGGFGRVWAARDEELETDVAIKELVLEQGIPEPERQERLRRARREARNAAKLRDHPDIVSVHDVVIIDEAPWIVMQLVTGCTLQERLAQKQRLSVDDTAELAEALLSALDTAHRQGIVHRDIKPANVMLTEDHQFLLTDFGIAVNQADSTLTATGLVIGSLAYLSPERAQAQKAGPASDLFSLGTTLYEAVEGICPFRRESPAGSLHAVAYEKAMPTQRAGRLRPLIEALLQKEPADRPTIAEARALLISSASPPEPKPKLPNTTKTVTTVSSAPAPATKTKPLNPPPAARPKSKSSVKPLTVLEGLGTILGILIVLYLGNRSFADWVSSGLNGDVSSAQKGDCVHNTGGDKWVQVPCWSAATKYTVEYRIASWVTWPRYFESDPEKTGCDGFYYYRGDSRVVDERRYRTVTFQGPSAHLWELCTKR